MSDKETLIRLISAGGENLIFNLDFIPADKFDWKPEPAAKSVSEIVNHLLENLNMFNGQFADAPPQQAVSDIASAKEAMQSALRSYEQNLRGASPEKLAETIELPGMTVTLNLLANVAVVDTLNHHGQITYIQSLLGDDETHFTPGLFEHLA